MYLWNLVGHNASQDRMRSGVGDDLPAIMRRIEGDLLDGSAFVARVYEVVFRVSVFDLGEIHVPTGRQWHGRRDSHGGVHWEQRFKAADPGVAYSLAADLEPDAIAG